MEGDTLSHLNKFKKIRKLLSDMLNSEHDFIDMPSLIEKVKLARNVKKIVLAYYFLLLQFIS